jgi:hypothetical protein
MSFKNKKTYLNIIYAILFLVGILFLYNRYSDKKLKSNTKEDYGSIQQYLLTESDLAKSKKPILWIHVKYEYNSREWISFGSRSSFNLNQPYMYLTVKSIITQCKDTFNICIIDDNSFTKLIPGWKVNTNIISNPVSDYIRSLGIANLLYIYGGILVPPSFLCLRNLIDLYDTGLNKSDMFVCENIDRNITSATHEFYPDISFMGSKKKCSILKDLIDFMQRIISSDYTAQSEFLGDFNRWCNTRITNNQITLIPGKMIGIKTLEDTPILVDNLLSSNYIDFYPKMYGIYIPADEILNRNYYSWFARLSSKQVLQSNTIIGKYILLANAPDVKIETIKNNNKKNDWIGYWQVPSQFGLWGFKPQPFATHLIRNKTDPKP